MTQNSYEQFKGSKKLESTVNRDIYKLMEDKFGEKYIIYRRKWSKDFKDLSFPLHIDIDLQDSCNQSCTLCHQNYRKRNNAIMSWNLLKKIIDEGAEEGLCAINFGASAEPLLQKKLLLKGISYADKKGIMDIFVHTNGILLDKDFSKPLIDSGLRHMCVSIDASNEDTYKKSRNSNAYNKVIKNVVRFVNIRETSTFPSIRVSFCPTPLNYKEIEDFKYIWKDVIDIIEIQSYRHMIDYKLPDVFSKSISSCTNFLKRIMVWADGDVSMCCGFRLDDMYLGNMKNNNIYDMWNNTIAVKIRKNFPKTCRKCISLTYKIDDKND